MSIKSTATVAAVANALTLFLAGVASAATITNITINDLTDSLSVSGPGAYNCSVSNLNEICRSAGSLDISFGIFGAGNPALGTYRFNIWSDAAHTQLSDTLQFFIGFSSGFVLGFQQMEFISDLDSGPPLTALTTGGVLPHNVVDIIENGTVQTALTLTSTVGDQFNVRFQSDVERVPEPGTLLLVGTALVGLVSRSWRRGKQEVPSLLVP